MQLKSLKGHVNISEVVIRPANLNLSSYGERFSLFYASILSRRTITISTLHCIKCNLVHCSLLLNRQSSGFSNDMLLFYERLDLDPSVPVNNMAYDKAPPLGLFSRCSASTLPRAKTIFLPLPLCCSSPCLLWSPSTPSALRSP